MDSRYLFLERQNVRLRADGCDRELVDLLVALGVVILDMGELCCTPEGIDVPVEVAKPPVTFG